MRARIAWTEELVEALRAMASSGNSSATVIGDRLGLTRSAVLGKLHRMGIKLQRSRRRAAPKPPRAPRTARSPSLRLRAPCKPPAEPFVDLPPGVFPETACSLADLRSGACHFPYGGPSDHDGFRYCGAPCSGSYCAGHRQIMYRDPPKPRTRYYRRRAR